MIAAKRNVRHLYCCLDIPSDQLGLAWKHQVVGEGATIFEEIEGITRQFDTETLINRIVIFFDNFFKISTICDALLCHRNGAIVVGAFAYLDIERPCHKFNLWCPPRHPVDLKAQRGPPDVGRIRSLCKYKVWGKFKGMEVCAHLDFVTNQMRFTA
ncbi:hypothetical protein CFB82_41045 [Burkholderia sp. HI2714]|nr:hypothetical protein CFB82_41045 [Burkholderia sp. HI2714]